jgi:hypothetical protein
MDAMGIIDSYILYSTRNKREVMKLIPMTDFVLSEKVKSTLDYATGYKMIQSYAKFLKQPLNLGMFVPCDKDGDVWKYPPTKEEKEWAEKDRTDAEQSFKKKEFYYNNAKERVLFKGFEIMHIEGCEVVYIDEDNFLYTSELENYTIEYLILCGFEIEITESAKKQIEP